MIKRSDDLLAAMQHLRFRQLHALMVLQEVGSIVRGAERLYLTQPALTKMLRDIEVMVGQKLFLRTNRGVIATPAGEVLCSHARRLLAGLRDTAEDLHAVSGGLSGRIVVGAMLTAASILVPATIRRLKSTLPEVTVVVREGTNDRHLPALLVGEVDMVVGRVPESSYPGQLSQEPLFGERARVFIRDGHPLWAVKGITLAGLVGEPWILPPTETALRRQIDNSFLALGVSAPTDRVETVSLLTARALLMQSNRIAVLPHHVLDLERRAGLVRFLPIDLPATNSQVGVILRRDVVLRPAASAFLDCLRLEAKRLQEDDLF